jgi:hypothetical protein
MTKTLTNFLEEKPFSFDEQNSVFRKEIKKVSYSHILGQTRCELILSRISQKASKVFLNTLADDSISLNNRVKIASKSYSLFSDHRHQVIVVSTN